MMTRLGGGRVLFTYNIPPVSLTVSMEEDDII